MEYTFKQIGSGEIDELDELIYDAMEEYYEKKSIVHGLILDIKDLLSSIKNDTRNKLILIINMTSYLIKFSMLKFSTTFDIFLNYKKISDDENNFLKYPDYYPCDNKEEYEKLINHIPLLELKLSDFSEYIETKINITTHTKYNIMSKQIDEIKFKHIKNKKSKHRKILNKFVIETLAFIEKFNIILNRLANAHKAYDNIRKLHNIKMGGIEIKHNDINDYEEELNELGELSNC